MAYLRYTRECEWYVFELPSGKLAVWHQDFRSQSPEYSESEVRKLVASGNLDKIPGCRDHNRAQLFGALSEWLAELRANHET